LLPFRCSTGDLRSSTVGLSESLSRLLERKLRPVPNSLASFTFSMNFANFSTGRCPSSCPARGSASAEAGDEWDVDASVEDAREDDDDGEEEDDDEDEEEDEDEDDDGALVVVDDCTVGSGGDGTGAKVTVRRGRGTGAGEVTVGVGSESGWDEDGADDGADGVDGDCADGCRLDFSGCDSAVMSVSTRMV
jgi:hypothetical protein